MYKRKKWKTIKKEAAEAYSEPCQMSMMECFCKHVTAAAAFSKGFIGLPGMFLYMLVRGKQNP